MYVRGTWISHFRYSFIIFASLIICIKSNIVRYRFRGHLDKLFQKFPFYCSKLILSLLMLHFCQCPKCALSIRPYLSLLLSFTVSARDRCGLFHTIGDLNILLPPPFRLQKKICVISTRIVVEITVFSR